MDLPTPARYLKPLKYQFDLVEYGKSAEPEVWAWAQSEQARQEIAGMRDSMLRQTYRLEPGAHPAAFEALHAAMAALEIEAPATLYQANDGTMNASLCYIPGEIHLIFYGPVLEKLSPRELLALMGHELAHYRLWSVDGGDFHHCSRILDHALSDPEATASHRETARLLSLHTELYADRGAALAAGEIAPAISVLVKIMTGIGTVDPDAYLRQAEELEARTATSEGVSHPETFLRARALDLWWRSDEALEDWLEQRLKGPLSIESLDLLRQCELTGMTRGFFARLLQDVPADESAAVLTQILRFFADFARDEEPLDLARIAAGKIDDPTRQYFIALICDCAMADPDARDVVMAAGLKIVQEIGALDLFRQALRRNLNWTKRMVDRLMAASREAA
ncbi:MAG: hydrolase [Alphaproteobacteria bacterium]|nr:hydrolase [Alphaproteobacteria bacterium]